MKSLEEVIFSLNQCYNDEYETNCEACLYFENGKNCRKDMIDDAIFYLKQNIEKEQYGK